MMHYSILCHKIFPLEEHKAYLSTVVDISLHPHLRSRAHSPNHFGLAKWLQAIIHILIILAQQSDILISCPFKILGSMSISCPVTFCIG